MGACLDAPQSPGAPCTACANDAACADDNPCTEDACTADGLCTHTAFCCYEVMTYEAGFEAGLTGWYVTDGQPGDAVSWTMDYTPSAESEVACTLVIVSSDSQTPTEVPISGWGAYPAQVVDIFTD